MGVKNIDSVHTQQTNERGSGNDRHSDDVHADTVDNRKLGKSLVTLHFHFGWPSRKETQEEGQGPHTANTFP